MILPMFNMLYLRLGFSYLLSCVLWPLAMLGYWFYRVLDESTPRLDERDLIAFAFHVLALLGWLTGVVIFIFPLLRTLS